MLLAGDIGGTKTLLGLFEESQPRPTRIDVQSFGTLDFDGLPEMIGRFLETAKPGRINAASFGVAGPVIDRAATLTNVPWRVDARRVAERFGFPRVELINDLEATAWAVPVLGEQELLVLQAGVRDPDGNLAVIAAGTGLGEALIHNLNGRLIPSASEGGHADFAARNEREIEVLRQLTARYGRVDVERVVSGPGIVHLHRVTGDCEAGIDFDAPIAPAAIATSGLGQTCRACGEALELWIEAYGAEAGNLALRSVSTGGLFVGGGIAPKLLPMFQTGAFMRAFVSKPPLDAMLAKMPVKIILNPEAGLVGAAVHAGAV